MPFTKDEVALHRCVNGSLVELSPEERQAIADEWNANEAKYAERQRLARLEAAMLEACRAIEQKRLEDAMKDPLAPQQVKDYVELLSS